MYVALLTHNFLMIDEEVSLERKMRTDYTWQSFVPGESLLVLSMLTATELWSLHSVLAQAALVVQVKLVYCTILLFIYLLLFYRSVCGCGCLCVCVWVCPGETEEAES